jgi:hypothetical protein
MATLFHLYPKHRHEQRFGFAKYATELMKRNTKEASGAKQESFPPVHTPALFVGARRSRGGVMDANFLEFWGQSLLGLAKGQRQMEEFSRLLSGGLGGSDSLSNLFRSIYGLDKLKKDSDEYLNLHEKATQSFQQSFREYLRLFDVTPRQEHESLVKECEALKQRILEQEQTIGRLRKILGDKGLESAETVRDLQNVLKKQVDQFQEVMTTIGQTFQKKPPSKSRP